MIISVHRWNTYAWFIEISVGWPLNAAQVFETIRKMLFHWFIQTESYHKNSIILNQPIQITCCCSFHVFDTLNRRIIIRIWIWKAAFDKCSPTDNKHFESFIANDIILMWENSKLSWINKYFLEMTFNYNVFNKSCFETRFWKRKSMCCYNTCQSVLSVNQL